MPSGIYQRSADAKKKISEAQKKRFARDGGYWIGKNRPEFSKEWKQKIGKNGYHYGMKGKKHTLESRRQMGE